MPNAKVYVREVGRRPIHVPAALGLVMPDGHGLFERISSMVANANGYPVVMKVEVAGRGRHQAAATMEIVLCPRRGAPGTSVLAYMEAKLGIMGSVVSEWGDETPCLMEPLTPLVPFRTWKRLYEDGELPKVAPAKRFVLQMTFTLIPPPPMQAVGVSRRRQVVETLSQTVMPIEIMFDGEELDRALAPEPMCIERRLAIAIGCVPTSNIEYCAAQSVLQPSGVEHRVIELVSSFGSMAAMQKARGLLYGLEQLFELRRGIVMES